MVVDVDEDVEDEEVVIAIDSCVFLIERYNETKEGIENKVNSIYHINKINKDK